MKDNDMNALLDEVRQAQREALRHANLLPKVMERVQTATIRRPFHLRLPALWMTAAVAGVAVAAFVWLQPAPLTVAIGDAQRPGAAGAVVDAPAAEAIPVRFSDGTAVTVAPTAPAEPAPTPAEAVPTEAPVAPEEPAPAVAPPALRATASTVSRSARIEHTADRSWTQLAGASHYQEALSAAEHTGFASL